MVTDNYFVIGFDVKYFFLWDVYMSAKGVFFPLTVTFVHANSGNVDEKQMACSSLYKLLCCISVLQ